MAVVDESESESESETGSEAETELQTEELDLSETEPDKAGKKDSGALVEESESETEATTEPVQSETKKMCIRDRGRRDAFAVSSEKI